MMKAKPLEWKRGYDDGIEHQFLADAPFGFINSFGEHRTDLPFSIWFSNGKYYAGWDVSIEGKEEIGVLFEKAEKMHQNLAKRFLEKNFYVSR